MKGQGLGLEETTSTKLRFLSPSALPFYRRCAHPAGKRSSKTSMSVPFPEKEPTLKFWSFFSPLDARISDKKVVPRGTRTEVLLRWFPPGQAPVPSFFQVIFSSPRKAP